MAKKSKIILFLIIVAFLFIPFKNALAEKAEEYAMPRILPDCDVTIYEVEKNGSTSPPEGQTGQWVKAEDYDFDNNDNILAVSTNNNCGFDDFVQLLINAFNYGLSGLAVIVLFMVIWGGFGLIIAAGNPEKIQEGKNTIKNALIGMLIVFAAWVLVSFVVLIMTGNKEGRVFAQDTNLVRFWWGGEKNCHRVYNDVCPINNLHSGCGGTATSQTSADVKTVQRFLNDAKCDAGAVDGCFGPQTEKAVKSFQQKNGLNVTGVVDQNTYGLLESGGQPCILP